MWHGIKKWGIATSVSNLMNNPFVTLELYNKKSKKSINCVYFCCHKNIGKVKQRKNTDKIRINFGKGGKIKF